MKYRKKPVIIEAMLFETNNEPDNKNMNEIMDWANKGQDRPNVTHNQTEILVRTLEGLMTAQVGDYIIKGVKGEFYPCKPDIFEMTYEKVEDELPF